MLYMRRDLRHVGTNFELILALVAHQLHHHTHHHRHPLIRLYIAIQSLICLFHYCLLYVLALNKHTMHQVFILVPNCVAGT